MKCNETSIVYGCTYKFSNCDTVDETEGNMNVENNQETKKERKKNQRERSLRDLKEERRKRNIRGPRILVPIRGIFLIIIAHIVI